MCPLQYRKGRKTAIQMKIINFLSVNFIFHYYSKCIDLTIVNKLLDITQFSCKRYEGHIAVCYTKRRTTWWMNYHHQLEMEIFGIPTKGGNWWILLIWNWQKTKPLEISKKKMTLEENLFFLNWDFKHQHWMMKRYISGLISIFRLNY